MIRWSRARWTRARWSRAAGLLVVAWLIVAPAWAATQALEFQLPNGSTDTGGLFGPAGGNLAGLNALLKITFETDSLCGTPGENGLTVYGYCSGVPANSPTASVTINDTRLRWTTSANSAYGPGISCYPSFTNNGVLVPQRFTIETVPNNEQPNAFYLAYATSSFATSCPQTLTGLPPVFSSLSPGGPLFGWQMALCTSTGGGCNVPACAGGPGAQCDEFSGSTTPTMLAIVDPLLLAGPSQGDINLAQALAPNPALAIAKAPATALSADGEAAALALFNTQSSSPVTFTVHGQATLLPWNPVYLQTAPRNGVRTLTVSSSAFVSVNGATFVPVLVQGPVGSSGSMDYGRPIQVVADQGGAEQTQALQLVPPPMLLVHGLWGDAESLKPFQLYIARQYPWSEQRNLIDAICYSKTIGFNQQSDPLMGPDPCEVTSAAAIGVGYATMLQTMDGQGIVGGRVDLVVHSMGGLAARHFATLDGYYNLRNRKLGDFHQIITLDTPELGSTLAPFLLANQNDTLQAYDYSSYVNLWHAFCGPTYLTAKLVDCFASKGQPVSYVLNGVEIGAVSSLEPGGSALRGLIPPSIPGATWSAVSAKASDNSTLYGLLNRVIGAAFTNPQAEGVPTLNSILRTDNNDAIVTYESQTYGGTGAAAYAAFPALEHSSLPYLHNYLDRLGYTNNSSVVDDASDSVNRTVKCWLEQGGAAPCAPTTTADVQSLPVSPLPSPAATSVVPDDTVAATLPAGMAYGQPAWVHLAVRAPFAVMAAHVDQKGAFGGMLGEAAAPVRPDGAGVAVLVTPQVLGPARFDFSADLAGGAVAMASATANVQLPASKLLSLKADHLPLLAISLALPSPLARLRPSATYAGVAGDVVLDARYVRYEVVSDTPGALPVVRVGADGLIRALRPGHADIVVHLGSATDRLPVFVTRQ